MTKVEIQMGAMSAALRMLLAGNDTSKPADLMIAASTGFDAQIGELMMSNAAKSRSTLLALFVVEDGTALLDKIMWVDATSKKGEINIGAGKFVQWPDGRFSILSLAGRIPTNMGSAVPDGASRARLCQTSPAAQRWSCEACRR